MDYNEDMKTKLLLLSLVAVFVLACQLAKPPQAHELPQTGYKHEGGKLEHSGSYIIATEAPALYAVVHGGQDCLLHPFVDSEIVSYASDGLIVQVFPLTWDGWTYIAIDKQQTLKCWVNRIFTADDFR
jgi:hypothetical protein